MDSVLFGDELIEYEGLKTLQDGKPYYVPEKSQLLCYAQDDYFEKNASFDAMAKFLRDHMKKSTKKAIYITEELQLLASMSETDMDFILNDLQRLGLTLTKTNDITLFSVEFAKLSNDTRMAINRGHTPNELKDSHSNTGWLNPLKPS